MITLIIETKTSSTINPEFIKTFLGKLRRNEAYGMLGVYPLLDARGPSLIAEATLIQSMADYMLSSGKLLGVSIDERVVFADCDDALVATFGDEWQLEQPYTMLRVDEDQKPLPALKELLTLFRKVNADCALSGETVAPLTDESYYTSQIMNIFGYSYPTAEDLAGKMHDFLLFQATGKDVTDLSKYSDYETGTPGRVYMHDGAVTTGLVIEDATMWPDDNQFKELGKWCMIIGNQQPQSDDLEELELELYDFAQSAGWCDGLEGATVCATCKRIVYKDDTNHTC